MNKKTSFTKVIKTKNEPWLQLNQYYQRRKTLTNLSVKDLFLSVANWFNDLEEGLEESEVTQPAGLIIELLPLCFLQAEQKKRKKEKQRLCSNYSTFLFHENGR